MKKLIVLVFVAFLACLTVQAARAAGTEWEFDRDHSSFFFEIKHIYYTTRGYFEDFDGTFRFDPENLENSTVDIIIKTKSVTTQLSKRDRHVRSDDFLDVRRYPQMRFQSSRIRSVKGSTYELEGRLTIKDVTQNVVVPFTFYGARENPFNPKQLVAGFEVRFTIDRLEYNVGSGKYYQMGVIGKDVDILISLEMLRKA